MTQLHIVGLILALFLNAALSLALRYYAVHHWRGPRGVLWRQAAGVALIFGCAVLYRFVFHPPFDGLLIIPALAIETLVILLLLEHEDIMPFDAWEGLTENGNLKRQKLQLLEDAMALDDDEWEQLRRLERLRMMRKLTHQALRYDGTSRSRGELEREADRKIAESWDRWGEEYVCYADEEDRRGNQRAD